ncbi:MAG: hypothetical protein ABIJ61_14725, partial [bacterium]
SQPQADGLGCLLFIIFGVAATILVAIVTLFVENPAVFAALAVTAAATVVGFAIVRYREKKLLSEYKSALDRIFVQAVSVPTSEIIDALKDQRWRLPASQRCEDAVGRIEEDVYHAVLDRVLDDWHINAEERATIGAAEKVFGISEESKLELKKSIFSSAYLEAIEDRRITQDEFDKLTNLVDGLEIPKEEVKVELSVVQEIIEAQELRLPFQPIPPEDVQIKKQKSEDVFFQQGAQVLSRHKSRQSASGYEYSVRRNGIMAVTDKRVVVFGDGTTSIRHSEISDIDVDIDGGLLEITKSSSGRPILIRTPSPLLMGRAIDLLAGDNS